MSHLAPVFFAAAVALVACGNPAPQSMPTSALPPVSEALQDHPATSVATQAPESAQCLDMVAKGTFAEAVPVCVQAVALDPENAAVKQALETARTKAATAALGSSPAIASGGNHLAAGALGAKLP